MCKYYILLSNYCDKYIYMYIMYIPINDLEFDFIFTILLYIFLYNILEKCIFFI